MKKVLFFFFFLLFPFNIDAAEILNNYIVMDMDSGRIIKELNKDERILPASTTKIMTLIVAIENSNLMDVVKVGDEILIADGTNIYAEVGENFLLEDLLYGMILRSGNDAALIIAKNSGGTVDNFVKLMNEKTVKLGLKKTSFQNPTGLDDTTKNYSSVNDLAIIYSYGYKNKLFRKILKTKEYKTSSDKKSYYFKNRTEIINLYDKSTGGKTGYTPKAGRLLISSSSNNDLNIVIASRGNTYGYDSHIAFYEEVFSNYKNYTILDKKSFKQDTNLSGELFIKNSFVYPLTNEELNNIRKVLVYNKDKRGYVADMIVYLGDLEIHKEKVYLKENKISFFKRIINMFK
ncbi:MAG: D-alanyl-D-alanine carboxypeptidase [Bacilli bacterium]|nr:D-alanyl-D-alanine carboxypeptidase [Bacilli bacterium]